ncbi:hypothetical protein [Paenibacillus sp. 1011MAR3C5]|nr:hypothetical protein [Paenibacillus sp. 1011MAR3C5]
MENRLKAIIFLAGCNKQELEAIRFDLQLEGASVEILNVINQLLMSAP